MVLGFLKMLGTASVALSGATTSSCSSASSASGIARHAAATMTTTTATAAPSSGVLGAAARGAGAGPMEPMRVKSPLIYSFPISNLEDSPPVYLKLDALQPSGSFKDRGMATLCEDLKRQGAKRLISSSGGNAGHSAALCGRVLGLPVRVIVPTTTKPLMLDKIRAQGAEVEVHGDNWNAADALARQLVAQDPSAAYIPPYDHPLLWEGHSTLVDELVADLGGERPAAIVASVGGGGLVCGIYEGLARHGWADVQVIATETEGAASFAAGFAAGKPVRLPGITSVATSLGALEVTPAALEYAQRQPTSARVVTDAEAVSACRRFLQDHRLLVEPACGAALALGYTPRHREEIRKVSEARGGRPVVIVVCGGSGVTAEILQEMERGVGLSG